MAGKIVGIEVGTRMTYVVEMDYKVRNPKIYQFFSIPTPEDVMADGSIRVMPEFAEQIRAKLSEYSIRTKKAIFVMNSTRIANREVMIPIVKEKQIHDLLVTNSAEFFPVDLTQYQLVHNIVGKNDAEKKYKLSVFAVPKDIVTSYNEFAEALNLEIEALDYIGNSIAQGMIRMLKDSVKVTIKVDERTSMLTLVVNDKLELQRNISYGIEEAVDVVMDSRVYGKPENFAQALDILRQNQCMNSEFGSGRTSFELEVDERQQLREEVTESVRGLVGNIRRILDYYTANNQDTTIEQIWLMGVGADCRGFSELLAGELNVRVSVLKEVPELTVNRGAMQSEISFGEYAACIAATLNPLAFGQEKKKGAKEDGAKNELLLPGVVCAGCLIASVVLAAVAVIPGFTLAREKQRLTQEIAALQEAEDIYQKYELTLAEYSNIQKIYNLTQTPDDALLAFLGEMEEKMPSGIVVETMTAGTEGVNMNLKVTGKPVAADVLVQLRAFDTLSSVSTQGLAETLDDAGKNSVTFSVSCQYADANEDETNVGEDTAAGTDTSDNTDAGADEANAEGAGE